MNPNHKPCPKCGKEMHRQSKTCKACQEKPENYITRVCPVCQREFSIHKSQTARGQGNYCSVPCARSGSPTRKRERVSVTCHTCGKDFEKRHAEIRKTVGDLHFCSSKCWYFHNRRENHYGWEGGQHERMCPEGRAWRLAVIKRDKGFCRLCHSQHDLEVHHIKRFATHPELRWVVSNGITLCHDCHILYRNSEEEYEREFSFIAALNIQVWEFGQIGGQKIRRSRKRRPVSDFVQVVLPGFDRLMVGT